MLAPLETTMFKEVLPLYSCGAPTYQTVTQPETACDMMTPRQLSCQEGAHYMWSLQGPNSRLPLALKCSICEHEIHSCCWTALASNQLQKFLHLPKWNSPFLKLLFSLTLTVGLWAAILHSVSVSLTSSGQAQGCLLTLHSGVTSGRFGTICDAGDWT